MAFEGDIPMPMEAAGPCACCSLLRESTLLEMLSKRKDTQQSSSGGSRLRHCTVCVRDNGGDEKEEEEQQPRGGKGKGKKGAAADPGAKSKKEAKKDKKKSDKKGGKRGTKMAADSDKDEADDDFSSWGGGKGAKAPKFPSRFVCMTCLFAGCSEHAEQHFHESSRAAKDNKRGGNHRQQHSVFLDLFATNAEYQDFRCRCFHCDIPVGNGFVDDLAGAGEGYGEAGEDGDGGMSYVDGIPVDAKGYCLDGSDYCTNPCEIVMQAVGDVGSLQDTLSRYRELHGEKQGAKENRPGRKVKGKRRGLGIDTDAPERKAEKLKRLQLLSSAGIVGLNNMGNTCFFNATLQCVAALAPLVQNIFADAQRFADYEAQGLPGPLSVAFYRFLSSVRDAGLGSVMSPKTLFGQICARNCMFAEYGQQDALELLMCLLNGMVDEFHVSQKQKAKQKDQQRAIAVASAQRKGEKTTEVEKDPSSSTTASMNDEDFVICRAVGGKLTNRITCHECQLESVNHEHFSSLSLPLRGAGSGGGVSLISALDAFFTPVLLTGDDSYLCERCCKNAFEEQERVKKQALLAEEARVEEIMAQVAASGGLKAGEDEVTREEIPDDDDDDEDEEGDEEQDDDAEADTAQASSIAPQAESVAEPPEPQATEDHRDPAPAEDATKALPESDEVTEPNPPLERAEATEDAKSGPAKSKSKTLKVASSSTAAASSQQSATPQQTTKKYVDATMRHVVESLGPCIALHLKRFHLNMRRLQWEKHSVPVRFPKTLNLGRYVDESDTPKPKRATAQPKASGPATYMQEVITLSKQFPRLPLKVIRSVLTMVEGDVETAIMILSEGVSLEGLNLQQDDDVTDEKEVADEKQQQTANPHEYELCGVVEHRGSLNGGHYVAYVWSPKVGQWFLCNDSFVSVATEAQVMAAEAYILFYHAAASSPSLPSEPVTAQGQ